jgi:type IV pilus assembly protein PilC
MTHVASPLSFIYQARTPEGEPISGSIDARDAAQAERLLAELRLQVTKLEESGAKRNGTPRPALHPELGQLIASSMPVSPSSEELRKSAGPLYQRLIGAGVSEEKLPAMLLGVGRHVELSRRLRAANLHAIAYPVTMAVVLMLLTAFLGHGVLPRFRNIFMDFGTKLPALTEWIMQLPAMMPVLEMSLAIGVATLLVVWLMLKATRRDRAAAEMLMLLLPVLRDMHRYSVLARWSDAAAVAVDAGIDLPGAIDVAGAAAGSPLLARDGQRLIAGLRDGVSIENLPGRLLPPVINTTIAQAAERGEVASAMRSLAEMYEQQVRTRTAVLPALVTGATIVVLAAGVGLVVLALYMPMISLIQNISSPMKK